MEDATIVIWDGAVVFVFALGIITGIWMEKLNKHEKRKK